MKKRKNSKIEIINGLLYCPECEITKPLSDFYLFEGKPKRPCKDCKLKYQAGYYVENKEDIEEYRQGYYQDNRDKIIARQLAYDLLHKEEVKITQKLYRQRNKAVLNKKKQIRRKERRKTDPSFKLRALVSNAIYQALRNNNGSKGGKSILSFLPNSIEEIRNHLQSLFEDWMTWKNWGVYDPNTWDDNDKSTWTWQIDHKKPQIALPYSSLEDDNLKICWSINNLQPLSAKDNNNKGDKVLDQGDKNVK